MKYLIEESDEDHPVNAGDIARYLERNGLHANRRTIYGDISTLEEFGMDILLAEGGKSGGYYLADRELSCRSSSFSSTPSRRPSSSRKKRRRA